MRQTACVPNLEQVTQLSISTAPDGVVRLHIPASSAYLSLARAATAGVCARLDFPLDRLEDLTLAVDEALALLLLDAVPGTGIDCAWEPTPDGVVVAITSTSSSGRTPRTTTFAWTVLAALVTSATAEITDGRVTLLMTADRTQVTVP